MTPTPQKQPEERRVETTLMKGAWFIKVPKSLSTEWQQKKGDQVIGEFLTEGQDGVPRFQTTSGGVFISKVLEKQADIVLEETKSTGSLAALGRVTARAIFIRGSVEECVKAVGKRNEVHHPEGGSTGGN